MALCWRKQVTNVILVSGFFNWPNMESPSLRAMLALEQDAWVVKRNARHMQSTIVRRLIDLIIVRPHLGYATQGWAPQSIYFISNLEKV